MLGVCLSVALLWLAARQVDFSALSQTMGQVHYPYILLAVGVYFVDLGFRALRWRVLLGGVATVSARRLYPVLAIGYMVNNLLPVRIGELSRAYLVSRRENIDASVVLASVAIERVVDGLSVVALLLVSVSVLPATLGPEGSWVANIASVAGASFGLGTVVIVALVIGEGMWVNVAHRFLNRLPGSIQDQGLHVLTSFINGLGTLRNRRRLAETIVLSIVIWLIGAFTYILAAAAFDVALSPIAAAATICVVNLATAVPLAPAGFGTFEVVAVRMLVLLNVAATTAFGMTIVLHAVLFFPVVVVGLICMWRAGFSFGHLWRRRESAAAPSAEMPA